MTFTDDDFKRLKDRLAVPEFKGASVVLDEGKAIALLARLEAAELCAEHGKLLAAYLSKKNPDAWEQGALEVWVRREEALSKAAGK